MNLFVHQNITIHSLKVEGISNSSVLQIGSAGLIKPLSQLFNTGGFTKSAPTTGGLPSIVPLIPLSPVINLPTRS
ncbi:spore germination protein GerPB [Cohnella sp. AR92]|uniref:spore germination protein GerPB n=1 Tax=Cohnella sp. AR92 TaxID=648716 RepID=UPI000F8CC7D5|nr:spore germination protein GerPB [Cohnella sp. AR92]RUS46958.1 spore gernimation protein [Cohnella sp. AR92]